MFVIVVGGVVVAAERGITTDEAGAAAMNNCVVIEMLLPNGSLAVMVIGACQHRLLTVSKKKCRNC